MSADEQFGWACFDNKLKPDRSGEAGRGRGRWEGEAMNFTEENNWAFSCSSSLEMSGKSQHRCGENVE